MMKSLFEYMLLEADEVSENDWQMFNIKSKGNIKDEFKAYTSIKSAGELGISKDGAKLQLAGIKKAMKISASGDVIKVFTEAFKNKNILDHFARNNPEETKVKGKPAVQVSMGSGWKKIALDEVSSKRCIKFWLHAIAVACNVVTASEDKLNVGINSSRNLLYVFKD